ncbi:Alpha/Beta hydrolase protein [Penicillium cf. griseofulvum]|uniref:Carboxylic ester hydrolase n=1 Tax=Penicillium cf. griseofulvum TaxID=2972120 RepID=A0A9W9M3Z5_9EURO|nr:Alpha/Beta hydrolase protein [Penicillium cf. griseofulvum]KAJ5433853.1 Alpha/Beta hydrolase protein [Penicillium cf. griseofulvum]
MALSLVSSLAAAHSSCATNGAFPTATVAGGVVIGTTTTYPLSSAAQINKYLGIPFAQSPPVRFLPPQKPLPWNSPLNATKYKPACIQQFINDDFRAIFDDPPLPESEDCLYLNVFAPTGTAVNSGKSVMLWIHGGSLQLGSASVPEYDGSILAAQQDIIVVTTNYRTNVFGFPTSPQLAPEERNLGFMDQRQALAWVSQNIRAFGGDPSKVTIFGESAGAYSVKQILANPPRPLQFRGAIMQSQALGDQGDGDKSWSALADALGCGLTTSQLECVRSRPTDRIRYNLNNQTLGFPPTVDNKTNFGSLGEGIHTHTVANVPLLIGTNADEGSILTSVMPDSQTLLEGIFSNDTRSQAMARAIYPRNITENELKSRIVTDYLYTCLTSTIASTLNSAGLKVWRYFFNASFPNNRPFPRAGARHTSEIDLIFGTYPRDNQTTDQQITLSKHMQKSWADFAKDPLSGPGWERVRNGIGDLHIFGADGARGTRSVNAESVDGVSSTKVIE